MASGEVSKQLAAKMLKSAGIVSASRGSDDSPSFGDDNGGRGGDDGGSGSGDLAGTWNATVSFPTSPGLDHGVTWTFVRMFDDVYTLTARRTDGAQQSGVGVELSHSRPDIGLYPAFDNGNCRYILIGDSEALTFAGFAIYKCADGFTATGSFTAVR